MPSRPVIEAVGDPKLRPLPPNPGLRGASVAEEAREQSPGAPRQPTLKEKKSWRRKRKRAEQSRRTQPAGHRARGLPAGPRARDALTPGPQPPKPASQTPEARAAAAGPPRPARPGSAPTAHLSPGSLPAGTRRLRARLWGARSTPRSRPGGYLLRAVGALPSPPRGNETRCPPRSPRPLGRCAPGRSGRGRRGCRPGHLSALRLRRPLIHFIYFFPPPILGLFKAQLPATPFGKV